MLQTSPAQLDYARSLTCIADSHMGYVAENVSPETAWLRFDWSELCRASKMQHHTTYLVLCGWSVRMYVCFRELDLDKWNVAIINCVRTFATAFL